MTACARVGETGHALLRAAAGPKACKLVRVSSPTPGEHRPEHKGGQTTGGPSVNVKIFYLQQSPKPRGTTNVGAGDALQKKHGYVAGGIVLHHSMGQAVRGTPSHLPSPGTCSAGDPRPWPHLLPSPQSQHPSLTSQSCLCSSWALVSHPQLSVLSGVIQLLLPSPSSPYTLSYQDRIALLLQAGPQPGAPLATG